MLFALLLAACDPSETVDEPDVIIEEDSGIADEDDTGVTEDTLTFSDDIEIKLLPCVGCHQGDAPDGGFSMDVEDLYGALVAQPSAQAEMVLIEPGDHRYSYLWHKLNGSQSVAGGAGTAMPLGTQWSQEDLDLLAAWIDYGAAP